MREFVSWTSVTGSTGNNLLVTAETIGSGPLVMFFDDSRRELSDRHRHAIDDLIAYGKKPPWTRDRVPMLPVSSSSPSSLHFGQALTDAVFPGFGRSIPAGIRTQMYIAGTKAAIAVERHRLAHGSYPASLAELVPAYLPTVPVDQFDGKALRYKVVDGKPLLYSVGCDGVDNGGTPYTPSDGASTNGHTDQWVPMNDRTRCPSGDWIIWPIHKPTPVGGK
jgi:hypothetical protein